MQMLHYNHMRNKQSGFSGIIVPIIGVVIVVIGLAGWSVYNTRHTSKPAEKRSVEVANILTSPRTASFTNDGLMFTFPTGTNLVNVEPPSQFEFQDVNGKSQDTLAKANLGQGFQLQVNTRHRGVSYPEQQYHQLESFTNKGVTYYILADGYNEATVSASYEDPNTSPNEAGVPIPASLSQLLVSTCAPKWCLIPAKNDKTAGIMIFINKINHMHKGATSGSESFSPDDADGKLMLSILRSLDY